MSDNTIYLNLVAKALESNDTLRDLVNGQIVPGFRRSKADEYLEETNKACIGIRSLSRNSQGLPGCQSHGISKNDHLIEIRVITLITSTKTDDSFNNSITSLIEQVLKGGIIQILDEIEYQVLVGPFNFTTLEDENISDRIESQTTIRLKYFAR